MSMLRVKRFRKRFEASTRMETFWESGGSAGGSIDVTLCGITRRSASGHASGRYIIPIPVLNGKGFNAYARPGLGTVHEVVLSDVYAGVISGAGNSEYHNIAGTKISARNFFSDGGLFPADSRDGNAVSGAGPIDKTGTVKALGRRRAAKHIGTAKLAFCRGGDGRAAAGGVMLRLSVGWPVGLFAAAGQHEKSRAQKQQRKAPTQGTNLIGHHEDPAGVERYNVLLCHTESTCK